MMRLILIFFLFPAVLLAQKKDYRNYDKAVEYYKEGNVEKAKKICLKLINNNEQWDNPHLLMGSIYANFGDIEKAVMYLMNVYDEDDISDVKGIEQIGLLYYNSAYYKEALYYLQIAHKLDSNQLKTKTSLFIKNCLFALQALQDPVPFFPKNLGPQINTEMAEYLPAITTDGETIVVTRRVEVEEEYPQEDFYVSVKDGSGRWQESGPFKKPINSKRNEGALSFSSDQRLLVFTACNRIDGKGSCDLYFSFSSNDWNTIQNAEFINTKYWESQGCFSPDKRYLYFVSNRPGGYGGKDIWRAEINNKDLVKIENLGPKINTKYDEMSPFIHADNNTLYFASSGHVGMGDFDLYMSRRIDADSEWGEVQNLGYPINTYRTENSLVVGADGRTAYYASDNPELGSLGKEDIFTFQLPDDLQAQEVLDLELDIITQGVNKEVVLKNVHFENNSYLLEGGSFIELDMLVTYLIKNPAIHIAIEGHTDNIGDSQKNLVLSENRAKSVYNYLIEKGVNSTQLTGYKGYGESRPMSDNDRESGRAENRRTSFVIVQ